MNREDLEHIIRAAADVTDQYEFVILGSQSILGSVPKSRARLHDVGQPNKRTKHAEAANDTLSRRPCEPDQQRPSTSMMPAPLPQQRRS